MKVCYFGTYRATYSRNVNMIEGLRRAGVEVIECHVPLWLGIEDRVAATKGGWKRPAFWVRVLKAYFQLLAEYFKIKDYDVLVVGYPGQFDVYLAWVLAWFKRKPLVWDVFMSIYLIALERELDQKSKGTVEILRRVERLALRLPNLLIHDTEDYVAWLVETHGVAPERFRLVPTGADDRVFHPQDSILSEVRTRTPEALAKSKDASPEIFRVVYFGTFIPNHGVSKIIEAARLLADVTDVQFEMIGEGPEREGAETLTRAYGLQNVAFLGWMEHDALSARVGQAQVCLGAFGETPQSLMTVQNKIFTGLALGVPVLSGDSPAVRRAFVHKEHLYLCARSGAGIVAGIKALRADAALRARLAKNGYEIFRGQYDLEHLGELFAYHLREVAML
ncbi:MAG: glycosyltransferase [Anaerolineales bacterium]|nr:glycosyltransferase [Anaerolineales bacterium]